LGIYLHLTCNAAIELGLGNAWINCDRAIQISDRVVKIPFLKKSQAATDEGLRRERINNAYLTRLIIGSGKPICRARCDLPASIANDQMRANFNGFGEIFDGSIEIALLVVFTSLRERLER